MSRFLRNLHPDFEAELTKLPLAELQSRGVKALAFDLDDTLTPARSRQLSNRTITYLKQLGAAGFKLFLASNAMVDITHLGAMIDATVIEATLLSRKPMKSYFRRLIVASGCSPQEIAMIGNRTLTDILGANRAGLITIKIRRTTQA